MIFNLKNREEFLNNFLAPVGRVADSAVLKLTTNKVSAIITTSDNTLVVYLEYNNIGFEGQKNLNIPDVKKLCRVLSCIEESNCDLDVSLNNISYTSSDVKFKYHLYEDNIIKTSKQINFDKLADMPFDGKFTISHASINSLIKGSSIATETNKIYLSFKDGSVHGELTDKSRANTDSYGIKISADFTGEQINSHIPLNFELFRIISSVKFKTLVVDIASKRGLLILTSDTDNTKIKFIASALQN